MKRLLFLIVGMLIFSNFAFAYEEQHLFDLNVYITVSESGSALFRINAKLKDPTEIAELESILKKDGEEKANQAFENLLYSLIYRNFVDDVKKKYPDAQIVIPADGLVKVGKNWSAVVQFKWYNYLVEDNKTLKSGFYGPLRFIYKNRVLSYKWNNLYLVLPKEAYVLNLAPAPEEFEENVAKWENGDYLPIVIITFDSAVYEQAMNKTMETQNKTTFVPFEEFLANTTKSITLSYDTWSGFLKFNATFEGIEPSEYHEKKVLEEFEKAMDINSISSKRDGNKLVIWGEAKPSIKYEESFTKKSWNVTVELPFRFDSVHVSGPFAAMSSDGKSVSILYVEKKSICGPGAILGISLIPLLLYRRRR
ncbi:hypothetical protein PAP_00485 [Palaeococcus pacificus DY20341]|uniref:CGP-CTERM sorting domain-containing protein n=1 Tax=Palaeococcus pacificus DY20341 TaxID=1343739 RepID=A0A075LQF0_9EURY|nr:CGP-CTERM sorting domain-containing protein [Palaeococcus pacificus]AIF68544.1 hypothetical protein PAP_00485 [Palaeococcus pacificus DY20341]